MGKPRADALLYSVGAGRGGENKQVGVITLASHAGRTVGFGTHPTYRADPIPRTLI